MAAAYAAAAAPTTKPEAVAPLPTAANAVAGLAAEKHEERAMRHATQASRTEADEGKEDRCPLLLQLQLPTFARFRASVRAVCFLILACLFSDCQMQRVACRSWAELLFHSECG